MKIQLLACAVFCVVPGANAVDFWPTNGVASQSVSSISTNSQSYADILKGGTLRSFRETNVVGKAVSPKPFIQPKAVPGEDTFPLPWVDRMDFDTVYVLQPTRWGSDTFFWSLIPVYKGLRAGPFYISDYPLSSTGPYMNMDTYGLGFRINF